MAKSGGSRKDGIAGLGRQAAIRVKTAKRRSAASTQWLARQLNDPYVGEAKRQGYRSRAAFKLLQLDDRFHLLRPGRRIVDLGCAPGGWTQVAVERVKPTAARAGQARGAVIGIDILPMDAVPGATVIALDFLDPTAPERLKQLLAGPADLVLSDMAAPTTGHRPGRGGFRLRARGPGARRRFRLQGLSGRRRGQPARRPEARLQDRAPRQAAGESRRIGRGLCRCHRVSRREPLAYQPRAKVLPLRRSMCIVRRHLDLRRQHGDSAGIHVR
jgi:hypothetical protein